MRRVLRDNSLSITLFGLVLISFVLHALGGHAEYNQQQHARPRCRCGAS